MANSSRNSVRICNKNIIANFYRSPPPLTTKLFSYCRASVELRHLSPRVRGTINQNIMYDRWIGVGRNHSFWQLLPYRFVMSSLNLGISGSATTKTSKLYLIPLTLVIVFPLTCLLTYVWAVLAGHVQPIYSYISDGGTTPPEMCFFGQFLHFVCILHFGVVYIRYQQVKLYYKLKYNQPRSKVNVVAYATGVLSILGMSLVANFQETNVLLVHVMGANLVFLGGVIWSCLQAYLSFKLLPDFSSRAMAYIRTVQGAIVLALFVIFQITASVSFFQFNGSLSGKDMLTWNKLDTGSLRGTAVVVEWIMSSFFILYITTLIPEFKKLGYKSLEICFLKPITDQEPAAFQKVEDISLEQKTRISQVPLFPEDGVK